MTIMIKKISTSSESTIILYCGTQMSILMFSVVNIKFLVNKWDFEELNSELFENEIMIKNQSHVHTELLKILSKPSSENIITLLSLDMISFITL